MQKRLPASEAAPVECGWGSVASRIVEHRGQGATHMRGNVRPLRSSPRRPSPPPSADVDCASCVPAQLKQFNKPSPAYSVAHDNGGAHFTA